MAGWKKRIKIIIDQATVDAALSNFPVLLYLSASSGIGNADVTPVFDELQADANRKKIAVTTEDGVHQCYVEIEEWDDANEEAWLWTKVPSVSDVAPSTIIYLYYDRNHPDNDAFVGDTNSTPAENVWDTNFVLVCHMRDGANTSSVYDSTGNNNDGAKRGANEPIVTTSGEISDAQLFDAVDDWINHGSAANLDDIASLTIEAWIYPTGWGESLWGRIADKTQKVFYISGSASGGVDGHDCLSWSQGWATDGYWHTADHTLVLNNWYHVAVTYSHADINQDPLLYIGGTSMAVTEGTAPAGARDSDAAALLYVGQKSGAETRTFGGTIDEVRISNIIRTTEWINASYDSGLDALLYFGREEIVASRVLKGRGGDHRSKMHMYRSLQIK